MDVPSFRVNGLSPHSIVAVGITNDFISIFCFSIHYTHVNHIPNRLKPVDLQIYVGSNDLKGNGTYYNVEKCIVHENYDEPLFSHDFAVVRVQGSIALNDKVQPIEYSSEEVPDGVVAQLTGWGRLTVNFVYILHLLLKLFKPRMFS